MKYEILTSEGRAEPGKRQKLKDVYRAIIGATVPIAACDPEFSDLLSVLEIENGWATVPTYTLVRMRAWCCGTSFGTVCGTPYLRWKRNARHGARTVERQSSVLSRINTDNASTQVSTTLANIAWRTRSQVLFEAPKIWQNRKKKNICLKTVPVASHFLFSSAVVKPLGGF